MPSAGEIPKDVLHKSQKQQPQNQSLAEIFNISLKNLKVNHFQMPKPPQELIDLHLEARSIPKYLIPRINFYSDLSLEFFKPSVRNDYKTFSENLAEIYRDSVKCIALAEQYCKIKKRSYLKSITADERYFQTKSISRKIEILGDHSPLIEKNDNTIKIFYVGLFHSLKKIHREYFEAIKIKPELSPPQKNNITEIDEEKIYHTILNEKSIEDEVFRNNFLKNILLLQIPTGHLHRIINPIPGIPSDPASRSSRAKIGGIEASKDKIEIIKTIYDYIKKNKPENFLSAKEFEEFNKEEINRKLGYKFKSLTKFCEIHIHDFMKIIDNYKERNPSTKYGRTLDPTNFQRYFTNWLKDHEELKAEMVFHIYSAEEKKLLKSINPTKNQGYENDSH